MKGNYFQIIGKCFGAILFLSAVGGAGGEEAGVTISNAAWFVHAAAGEVRDISWMGKPVFGSLGNVRVAEIKELSGLRDVARFVKKGAWQGQEYAMWEGRLDDGKEYILDFGQVIQVGEEVVWTTHVTWLPPVFLRIAHLQVELSIPRGAVDSMEASGKRIELKQVPQGAKINVEEGVFLKGQAGAFMLRFIGFNPEAELIATQDGAMLRLMEEDYYYPYAWLSTDPEKYASEILPRFASKWVLDLKHHQMSIIAARSKEERQ